MIHISLKPSFSLDYETRRFIEKTYSKHVAIDGGECKLYRKFITQGFALDSRLISEMYDKFNSEILKKNAEAETSMDKFDFVQHEAVEKALQEAIDLRNEDLKKLRKVMLDLITSLQSHENVIAEFIKNLNNNQIKEQENGNV